ncbi:cytochrome P450 family protein [Melittangium boletus]|uniref:Cytochrome P450 n=1 Tax=Melittangium boletus DSM 14713 TaxID=1294270 RepID=A0A250IPN3_9BACT|nr:cytochrome P450 [Melittangium boletus]ATB33192.1 cytochrome P450 [Melittangium boletus DSM 14713]
MTTSPLFAEGETLWSPHVRANPFPLYKRMREEFPVARITDPQLGMHFWLLTRYDDVVSMVRDPRFTQDPTRLPETVRQRFFGHKLRSLSRHLLTVDPPDHTRMRSLVSKVFTPRRIEELRPRITAICSELLENLKAQGSGADFLKVLAFPLPVIVIAELLGIPSEDRDQFREWTQTFFAPPSKDSQEKAREAYQLFFKYLEELFERRRQQPQDDLISALIAVQEQGDRLSAEELMSMVFLLLVGGYETTAHLLGNGLLELLRHPEQLQRLREDRALIPSAVEEMVRYCGTFELSILRFAKEDLELHGQHIPAHEAVRVNYLAADRDPGAFSEPDRFDVGRTPNKHVGFGHASTSVWERPSPGWRPSSPSSCCWSDSRSCVWPRNPRSSCGARVPKRVGW